MSVRGGGAANSCPDLPAMDVRPVASQDHSPTCASSVSVPVYPKTFTRLPLTRNLQSPTPLPLPCLCHTCQITVDAAKLLQQKYLLMQPSAYSPRLPDTQSLFYYGELIYLYCWDHRYTLHRHSKRSSPISKTTEHDLILIKKQKSHEHTQPSKIA